MDRTVNAHGKSSPIFQKIIIPMGILIVIEILQLIGTIFGGGVTAQLNQNAKDILQERVINRKNYLANEMVSRWSNVDMTVQNLNRKVQQLADAGRISIDTLDESSESCTPVLLAVADDLISMMRSNRVTGVYLVFNNGDLDEAGAVSNKPGIYIRDLDPVSNASYRNTDLLLERAPVAVVQSLNISTDSFWRPMFDFEDNGAYSSFLYEPYQAAYRNDDDSIQYADFGYWSHPYALYGDDREVISYSVPLVLENGQVYGVLGVDLTLDYLRKVVPYDEILEDKMGSYILAVAPQGDLTFDTLMINGPIYQQALEDGAKTAVRFPEEDAEDAYIDTADETFYCSVEYLNLYNTNTAFSSQRWALIGAVRTSDLFSFSNRITTMLSTAIFSTLLVGVLGSLIISRMISKPMVTLTRAISDTRPDKTVELHRTGITEVDRLSASIEDLSRDVLESATKFTQIMEMASVKIAGFEVKLADRSLFITDGFFRVFHRDDIDTKAMTVEAFRREMDQLTPYLVKRHSTEDDILYKLPTPEGACYVKLTYSQEDARIIGLVEDVTRARLERDLIEHERDYDLLTGLLNRRAFYKQMRQLFESGPDVLKVAALVMLDLDNLKNLNDTYGHDCGDKYIKSAADCFAEFSPGDTVLSRISGDEFYLFYFGYSSKEEIRLQLEKLKKGIHQKTFLLPSLEPSRIMASGGVAWYPDDSTSLDELLKFSDFAMYKVKHSVKGEFREFDIGVYSREAYLLQNKAELTELIEKELLQYHFQPIVDAKTGRVFGYEALMRANMPTLRSPNEIITLAKLEAKLNQIEVLTWFKSLEAYAGHIQSGKIAGDCKLFINSIANQLVPIDKFRILEEQYHDLLHNIVLEITEEEKMEAAMIQDKVHTLLRWNGSLALDDYGSGYNSEKMLLNLAPEFIKIDLSIIRDIDRDANKRKIVENTVSYAHERNMFVVAEGLETLEEMRTVIHMDVDYLQGFYLAKPALEPPVISEIVRQQILNG